MIGIGSIDHRTHIRLAVVIKPGRKRPIRTLRDLRIAPREHFPVLLIAFHQRVDGFAVRSRNRRHIQRRAHAALDLEGVNPRIAHVRDMIDHAEVPRIEDECPSLILVNRQILARPRLLHDGISPPARVRAVTVI